MQSASSSKPTVTSIDQQGKLETFLRELKRSMFLHHYQTYAQDAARSGLSYERYLLALCEVEMAEREIKRVEHVIKMAKLPFFKEIATYDFSAIENVSQARILELAKGGYLSAAEHLLLLGNRGTFLKLWENRIAFAIVSNFASPRKLKKASEQLG